MIGHGDLLMRAADAQDSNSFECSECHRESHGECTEVEGRLFCQREECQIVARGLEATALSEEETARIYAADDMLEAASERCIASRGDASMRDLMLDYLDQVTPAETAPRAVLVEAPRPVGVRELANAWRDMTGGMR